MGTQATRAVLRRWRSVLHLPIPFAAIGHLWLSGSIALISIAYARRRAVGDEALGRQRPSLTRGRSLRPLPAICDGKSLSKIRYLTHLLKFSPAAP